MNINPFDITAGFQESENVSEKPTQEPTVEQKQEHFGVVKNFTEYKSATEEDFPKEIITEILALPSMLREDFNDAISGLLAKDIETNSDKAWFGVGSASSDMAPTVYAARNEAIDLFAKALLNTERRWVQRVGDIMARPPSIRPSKGKIDGKRAVQYARSAAGMSTYFSVPLWHTGGHCTFISPSEGDYLHFMEKLSTDLEELGRRTNGLFLSAEAGYLLESYLDFALQHVDECTIKAENWNDLKTKISIHDIPAMVMGVAGAFWSKGFRYRRSCMADHTVCRHEIAGKIDLRRMIWTDESSVPSWALENVMSSRKAESIDDDLLKRYKAENPRLSDVKVKIIDGFHVEFTVCSAAQYFDSSRRWISSLEEKYIRSMSYSKEERADTLINQSKASVLRQYAHFVKSITIHDALIDKTDDIESTLDTMSEHDEFRKSFFKAVSNFIDDSTFSLVGVPSHTCPNCGAQQIPANAKRHVPGIIPINVFRFFFYLWPQRAALIRNR